MSTDASYPKGVKTDLEAMKAAGAQPGFVNANLALLRAFGIFIILRTSNSPQTNKKRSPKSGINSTKTSNQSFFKGVIPRDPRFARLEGVHRTLRAHDKKDLMHLQLPPEDIDYQHTKVLDVTMRDILRELGDGGDLEVLGFDVSKYALRLGYREGKGPPRDRFDGQFIIHLTKGDDTPDFYVRPWDKPEFDNDWDPVKKIIKKPDCLSLISDDLYASCFNQRFLLYFSEEKIANPTLQKTADVFANRPRTAYDFIEALGEHDEAYPIVKECEILSAVLNTLIKALGLRKARQVILNVYDESGVIVASDWDGIALGIPLDIKPEYTTVYDTFDMVEGSRNIDALVTQSENYFQDLKQAAQTKNTHTPFERMIVGIERFVDIVGFFALARAGCITPHEFLFQQLLNYAYRDKASQLYGLYYDLTAVQDAMDTLLIRINRDEPLGDIRQTLIDSFESRQSELNPPLLRLLVKHLTFHVAAAQKKYVERYPVPHLEHDPNIHDLYQHGFEMRSPYGCHLDAPWFLMASQGEPIYGETQNQLINVLLQKDFLAQNRLDISPDVEMSLGWDQVIEYQLRLNHVVPEKTLCRYQNHLKKQSKLKNKGTSGEE